MSDTTQAVAEHYGRGGLLQRLLQALRAAGKDIDNLTIDDLAPVDEFHSRQREATEALARMLSPPRGAHIIDMGSGLGGPSRFLAKTYECRVNGIDLTAEFVEAAQELTRRAGLSDQVEFRQGSVLDLPFPDASFDLAWTQNVAMNIADRERWYAEVRRVLKPRGRLALQDVTQGPGGPLHYPVMWAETPATSFLRTPEETRDSLEASGFRVLAWKELQPPPPSGSKPPEGTGEGGPARRGFTDAGLPPLGIHLIVGPSFLEKMRNGERNTREDRARLINAVVERI